MLLLEELLPNLCQTFYKVQLSLLIHKFLAKSKQISHLSKQKFCSALGFYDLRTEFAHLPTYLKLCFINYHKLTENKKGTSGTNISDEKDKSRNPAVNTLPV